MRSYSVHAQAIKGIVLCRLVVRLLTSHNTKNECFVVPCKRSTKYGLHFAIMRASENNCSHLPVKIFIPPFNSK